MKDKVISINGRKIGQSFSPFIIAEMSANHNGSINNAYRIIDMAKKAGADCVKFQLYDEKTLAHPNLKTLNYIRHNSFKFQRDRFKSLKLNISEFQEAKVKLLLADILVLQEKFNEALIFYSQIQMSLKNSTISQEARFKVAKTSYYKGDFEWAESQLKILF